MHSSLAEWNASGAELESDPDELDDELEELAFGLLAFGLLGFSGERGASTGTRGLLRNGVATPTTVLDALLCESVG